AIYLNVLSGKDVARTSRFLAQSYIDGTLSYQGNIRQVLTSDDFNSSTMWEFSMAPINTYQNGAYWATPLGWVVFSIAKTDMESARKLAYEYIANLQTNDFRKGPEYGAPYECLHPSGYRQNPVYLTSVACPYIVFKGMIQP